MRVNSQGMRDRSMLSGTEMGREIKLTDWSMAGNLSNRSSGVQIPRDICTRLERYIVLCEVQLDNKGVFCPAPGLAKIEKFYAPDWLKHKLVVKLPCIYLHLV